MTDQQLYQLLRVAGVVESQYDLSKKCRRSPGWFSSTRRQGREMTPTALIALVGHMLWQAERERDPLCGERLRVLASHVQTQIATRVISKPRIIHQRKAGRIRHT